MLASKESTQWLAQFSDDHDGPRQIRLSPHLAIIVHNRDSLPRAPANVELKFDIKFSIVSLRNENESTSGEWDPDRSRNPVYSCLNQAHDSLAIHNLQSVCFALGTAVAFSLSASCQVSFMQLRQGSSLPSLAFICGITCFRGTVDWSCNISPCAQPLH